MKVNSLIIRKKRISYKKYICKIFFYNQASTTHLSVKTYTPKSYSFEASLVTGIQMQFFGRNLQKVE